MRHTWIPEEKNPYKTVGQKSQQTNQIKQKGKISNLPTWLLELYHWHHMLLQYGSAFPSKLTVTCFQCQCGINGHEVHYRVKSIAE